jgi:DNA-binding PadR family transcriptional regulator
MSRWDITDHDRIHSAEAPVHEKAPGEPNSAAPSDGRGGSSASSPEELQSRQEATERSVSTPRGCRTKHEDHGQAYSLRESEIHAMTDIGRFRAVDVKDLARFVYQGDTTRMKYDLENLRKQGLIEEKTVFRAHKPSRRMVTLTDQGQRIVRKASGIREEQRVYHGFVKPKELDHDADLYKVYQKAAKKIEEGGGKPVRVRLDFELKESINRAKEAAGHLPKDMRERWLRAEAEEHGLTTDGSTIHLPDLQVEYITSDGRLERENLELLSKNYREDGIRSKVSAGFTIYARAGEMPRIRRALQETGLVREVLSL